jgi:Ca2+-binding RTX toxin-like protein
VTQDGIVGHDLRRDRFDQIFVDARDGNDRVAIDEANGVFTDTETTTVDGGAGNDDLIGGRGNETFDGGPGDDSVDGNQGADAAFLGAGDDSFTWDNGDGSDVVEGEDGSTRWSSTARPVARSSPPRTTADGCASRATSATS